MLPMPYTTFTAGMRKLAWVFKHNFKDTVTKLITPNTGGGKSQGEKRVENKYLDICMLNVLLKGRKKVYLFFVHTMVLL